MSIITSEKCLAYHSPGHPESPERVGKTLEYLKGKGFGFIEPVPAKEEDILRVHSAGHLQHIKTGGFFDPDTPALPGIYDPALLSCGGAIKAAELAFKGEPAFSLFRPPGHHSTREAAMGFCYFNSIAVAVRYLQAKNKELKTAIIDFDCHHGNGTEDIFLQDKNVLYVSLHQSPCYPGTGLRSKDNARNYPLSPGTDGKKYLEVFDRALGEIVEFGPEIVAVSAGFDAYREDPLTSMGLSIDDFSAIGRKIKGLGKKTFSVLEGGYSPDLPELIFAYLSACNLI